jgi:peptidoglycan/LPS O-acetylase OafA/YrhL
MSRTLLAVGVAALVSMLFTPHKDRWHWGGKRWDWADSYRFPAFCVDVSYYGQRNTILWSEFAAQTAFVAVLAAVIVNIPWRRKLTERPATP